MFPFIEFQSPGKPVLNPDLDQDRVVFTHPGPDGPKDFVVKAKAVFEFPAPGVGPAVGEGRQKLAQQIGVGPVDLNRVQSGFLGPAGGLAEVRMTSWISSSVMARWDPWK